ncbi:MAG: hypothetical protein ABI068_15265 [Ktedonobacterales bacterium]
MAQTWHDENYAINDTIPETHHLTSSLFGGVKKRQEAAKQRLYSASYDNKRHPQVASVVCVVVICGDITSWGADLTPALRLTA